MLPPTFAARCHATGRACALCQRRLAVTDDAALLAAVCREYGITIRALTGPSRDPLLVEARAAAMLLLHAMGRGCTRIGRVVHRDHSTVLHHVTKYSDPSTVPRPLAEMLCDVRRAVSVPAAPARGAATAGERRGR